MTDKEIFLELVKSKVCPAYDVYMYGMENGWKLENIIIGIVLQISTASVNMGELNTIMQFPRMHQLLEEMFESKFEVLDLLKCTVGKSYARDRIKELSENDEGE